MEDSLKKVLPVGNPPIKGYQFFAYPLSVICTNQQYMPWLCNHYIQLFCNPNEVKVHFYEPYNRYTNNPWFDCEVISKSSIQALGVNINDLVTKFINRGYYIVSIVDEFYIPNRRAYNKYNMEHDILIFGYDQSNRRYDIMGYDENNMYSHTFVSFNKFEKSFYELDNSIMYLFKLNNAFSCGVDLHNIIQQLDDYLCSRNSSRRLRPFDETQDFSNHVFGLETYNEVIKYMDDLINNKVDFNIFSLHFMYEHKKCMLLRIKYLGEEGYIRNGEYFISCFAEIEQQLIVARNLQLKYAVGKDTNNLNKIIHILKEIFPKEKKLIQELLTQLKLNCHETVNTF